MIYVCSDIHGLWNRFEAFINTLKEDDKVYFLGDAIDRGHDGIKILKYMMNDKRFTALLGNHEYLMYDFLNRKRKKLYLQEAYELWIQRNHGKVTLNNYSRLTKEEQDEIFNYIENMPLNIPDLCVNGKHFALAHSGAVLADKQLFIKTTDSDIVFGYVWARFNYPYDEIVYNENLRKDITMITGHTPTRAFINNYTKYCKEKVKDTIIFNGDDINKARMIDIDCGCAGSDLHTQFAVLCLDDLSVKYY